MASSSENALFNIEKLEGNNNFSYWKEHIYNVLVQKKQVKPIKLQGVNHLFLCGIAGWGT